jgi:hypothetical protein
VRQEPFLLGVLSQATSLVRNRGWSLTGGRNQVIRTKNMIHDANRKKGAVRGEGYRDYITRMARGFYSTNLGAINENGRDAPPRMIQGIAESGPLRAMWSADSTRFYLRSRGTEVYPLDEYPLAYKPVNGREQKWRHPDFFRVVANPSLEERMNGAGYCPVAIVKELAEIMVAVYRHDKEMLLAASPKAILILQNISDEMWGQAMRSNRDDMTAKERELFNQAIILAGPMGMGELDAKLIALSHLPANWDQAVMTDILMYLYALAFGFPPDEFWPVNTGTFGRGQEAMLGIERQTAKGDADFFSSFQEKFQAELPGTVLWEYDQRDDRGRLLEAEIATAWADIGAGLYMSVGEEGALLNKQQTLTLLVEKEVISPEVSAAVEDTVATDTEVARLNLLREELMDTSEQVQRAVVRFPNEPIVRYVWPDVTGRGREIVLWERGSDATKRKSFPVAKRRKHRAVLYTNDEFNFSITDEDVESALDEAEDRIGEEFVDLLTAEPLEV